MPTKLRVRNFILFLILWRVLRQKRVTRNTYWNRILRLITECNLRTSLNNRSQEIRMANYHRRSYRRKVQFYLSCCMLYGQSATRISRTLWTKQRSDIWWDYVVSGGWSENDWIDNFRMSKVLTPVAVLQLHEACTLFQSGLQSSFLYICRELKPLLEKVQTPLRGPIPVEKRVAIAVWRLSTNVEYRTISHLFGVGRSTASKITQEVSLAIVTCLLPVYITFPTGERIDNIVQGFNRRWGFPQCVGSIDGTHIPIRAPSEHPNDYYNRKGFHSIVVQAVVDYKYCFLSVYVGWPGSVHNARVFSNSLIHTKGEAGTLLPHRNQHINNVDVPLLLLGDLAYPLLPYLMKPFPEMQGVSPAQLNFNYRLSKARMTVENAFARLKARWQCLLKKNDTSIDKMPIIIMACCTLHNICELNGEVLDYRWLQDERILQHHVSTPAAIEDHNATAVAIRTALTEHFHTE